VTAEQHRTPANPPTTRPNLTVITSCGTCGVATTKVVDRDGTPVVFDAGPDGKAVRDPYGGWWIAKYRNTWTVVKPAPGEDPPTTGGGARLREHECGYDPAVALIKHAFPGAEVIATFEVADLPDVGPDPAPDPGSGRAPGRATPIPDKPADQVEADGFRRPTGRSDGVRGPACPQRPFLSQVPQPWAPPFTVLCVRCSRLTNRVDLDGMAWCGGDVAWPELGPPWYPTRR
jgi:hypothetical protein